MLRGDFPIPSLPDFNGTDTGSKGISMQSVNIHAAKTQLSRLVQQAAAGEEIIIARAGRPLARLVPLTELASRKKRVLGALTGLLIPDNLDAPLPDGLLTAMEGR